MQLNISSAYFDHMVRAVRDADKSEVFQMTDFNFSDFGADFEVEVEATEVKPTSVHLSALPKQPKDLDKA